MKRFYTLIIIFTLGFAPLKAQEAYVEHTIVKGETIYAISKIYNVTIGAIFELNPSSAGIIYPDEILRIPNINKTSTSQSKSTTEASNLRDHIVKRGETKFGLSKKFGVSIAMLEQQNPHIIAMLQAGHVIKVDKNFNSQPSVTNKNEHRVVKGETLWGISKQYNIGLSNLVSANSSQLSEFLQIDQILTIPNKNTVTQTVSEGQYIVQRGETKFGLAKRFKMTIAELEEKNPQIIPMLMAGHQLNVIASPIDNTQILAENTTETTNLTAEEAITEIDNSDHKENDINNNLEKDYFNYIIQPKETLYSLSKKADLTIDEFTTLNPKLLKGVNKGDIIKMTLSSNKNAAETNANTIDSSDVTAKEGVTITTEETEEIKKGNVTEVVAQDDGAEIAKSDIQQNEDNNTITTEYFNYRIQPKETLYSLSKKAGLTIDDFTTLNPKLLKGVNKGDIIKMPSSSKQIADNNNVTPVDSSKTLMPEIGDKNRSLISDLDFSEKNGVYFYLPFSDKEFNSDRFKLKSDNQDLQKYFEFYEGAQIAIDSAKALNLEFDVTLIEKKDETNSKFEIRVDNTNTENAIVIPFLEVNTRYPEIISNKNVSIIDIESNASAYPNTIVYKSIPSEQFQKTKTLEYLAGKENTNIIVISELENAPSKNLILKTIRDATFLKVDKAGFFNTNQLNETLKKDQLNYVILDSQQTIIFLNTTTSLMGQLAAYDIQLVLLDSKLLPKQNEASEMRFKILKLIYPTLALKDDLGFLNNFEIKYQRLYDSKPTMNAIKGFDVTFDLLLRLSQTSNFENSIHTILNSEHIQFKFSYEKTNRLNYTNTSVYLMQFNTDNGSVRIH
jgi:LysM repeat protein